MRDLKIHFYHVRLIFSLVANAPSLYIAAGDSEINWSPMWRETFLCVCRLVITMATCRSRATTTCRVTFCGDVVWRRAFPSPSKVSKAGERP